MALRGMNGSLAETSESVRLLVTELVTNSVRHADVGAEEYIEIELVASRDGVRVDVTDRGPGFDPSEPRRHPGGFGLILVEEIADRWGVDCEDGSRVWFEIDHPPGTGPPQRRGGQRPGQRGVREPGS
jgi:anti-sigma regulatory factor (Ser/Thr protein kinase)